MLFVPALVVLIVALIVSIVGIPLLATIPFLLAAFYLPFMLDRARRSGLGRFSVGLQRGSGLVVALMGIALMTGQLTTVAGWLMQAVPAFAQLG